MPDAALLTPGQVARIFGVNPRTVARWVRRGHLASIRTPGGHHRFHREDVTAILARPDRPR